MGNLCKNIHTFLAVHALLANQLQNPNPQPSSPEAAAIERLKDSGIPLSNKKPKRDTCKVLLPHQLPPLLTPQELVNFVLHLMALATPEEEDAFVVKMMHGFAAPEGTWTLILTATGLHSNQKVTIKTATATATAEVPGQPVSLVTAESPTWHKLNTNNKGVHNRELFMAQIPKLFDADKTDTQKHKMLMHSSEHLKPMNEFLCNDCEPLTYMHNQAFHFGQVFGFAAVIHPTASIDSLGCRILTLSHISRRLHLALAKCPKLHHEIKARANANLNVIHKFLHGIIIVESKENKFVIICLATLNPSPNTVFAHEEEQEMDIFRRLDLLPVPLALVHKRPICAHHLAHTPLATQATPQLTEQE
ncbi:hypothetical protein FB451DRAFT_1167172 [Mycena latifolia]|nr:hypothetical protein FB451DRAFT_1167172 [Mycena latifolia]